MSQVDIPHFSLPFRLGPNGHPRVHEQDSLDDIGACVEAIVRTEKGERVELPEFGITDPLFKLMDLTDRSIPDAISRWEPRAVVAAEEGFDFGELIRRVRLDITES